jgi:outer membrane protein assembly factor BamA
MNRLNFFLLSKPGKFPTSHFRPPTSGFQLLPSAFCLLFILILFSCSNTKYLPRGEKLYTGSKVNVTSPPKLSGKKSLEKKLQAFVRPKPNAKAFRLFRAKLWFYNIAGDSAKAQKGFRHWVKYRLGEPPVLLSEVKTETNREIIDAKLFNSGYFFSTVTDSIIEKNKTAKIIYNVETHAPYTVSEIRFPKGDDNLSKVIAETQKETLIMTKENYDLDVLKNERIRIDQAVKEKGYYYFNPDYLIFDVDTTTVPHFAIVNVNVKEDIPDRARRIYKINDVFVTDDYSIGKDSVNKNRDTVLVNDTYYISGNDAFRPKAIVRTVFIKKEHEYNRHDQNMTLSRLMGLGAFKFATVRFTDLDSVKPGYLNANIYLTPLQKRSIRLELQGISKSNNFIGPGFNVSYRNRNAFRGSELFIVNLKTSYEFQYGKTTSSTLEIGPSVELYVPKFMTPFRVKGPTSYFIPRTKFSFGYDYLQRTNYFTLYTLNFTYGYKWKETLLKEHEWNPVVINFVSITQKSDAFNALLAVNPLLRRSFEEQFITGATYSFTYNEQLLPEKITQLYFNGRIDVSGNTAYLFSKLTKNRSVDDTKPYEIAASPFSQYAKAEADVRYYFTIDPNNKVAFRIYGGVGKAYGNSITLPYIKQFFSGGVSSIRAFSARTLGPGSYYVPDSIRGSVFFEQGGDIKLETNAEYRFGIVGIVKGALFVDAGNIWLIDDNPDIPGGKFTSNFLDQFAVGTGFGLRVDPGFFVIRLDLAFPLRKPWLAPADRWTISDIKFGNSQWRRDNLVFNIAIGYPF